MRLLSYPPVLPEFLPGSGRLLGVVGHGPAAFPTLVSWIPNWYGLSWEGGNPWS